MNAGQLLIDVGAADRKRGSYRGGLGFPGCVWYAFASLFGGLLTYAGEYHVKHYLPQLADCLLWPSRLPELQTIPQAALSPKSLTIPRLNHLGPEQGL